MKTWLAIILIFTSFGSVAKSKKKKNLEKRMNDLEKKVAKFSSFKGDSDVEYSMGTTLFFDAVSYHEDKQTFYDGSEVRKAEFYIKGKLPNGFKSSFKIDTSGNGIKLKTALLSYNLSDSFSLNLGIQKPPGSHENMMSSKNTLFMERSLPSEAFEIDRSLGLSVSLSTQRFSSFFGVFGDGGADTSTEEELHVGARFTALPVMHSKYHFLHVGTHVVKSSSLEDVRFKTRPESHLTSVELVDTGTLTNTSKTMRYGGEIIYQLSSLQLQYEYLGVAVKKSVEREGEVDSLWLWGQHFSLSYLLFGDTRSYDSDSGVVKGPKFDNYALELLLRCSYIDLNDHMEVAEGGVEGAVEHNLSFGLNYYLNSNVRVMLNHILIKLKDRPVETDNESPSLTQARVQVNF